MILIIINDRNGLLPVQHHTNDPIYFELDARKHNLVVIWNNNIETSLRTYLWSLM